VDQTGGGEFTADSGMAFIYPDLHTAFVGSFQNGRMTSAKATVLTDVVLDRITQVMYPIFDHPPPSAASLQYSKATKTFIGDLGPYLNFRGKSRSNL
jgi:hypothetical protein